MSILKNQVVLLTGASRGIGRALATTLARQGMHLALVARDPAALQQTAEACQKLGAKTSIHPHDLSKPDGLAGVVDNIVKSLGGLHHLINNAGVWEGGAVSNANLEAWDRCLDLNIRSVVHLTKFALPHITKASNGTIINMASVASRMTQAGSAIYSASKHALLGFSNALFEDIRETGTKVAAICPGFVNTEMTAGKMDTARIIQPEDIAHAVMYVLTCSNTVCPTEIWLRPQYSPRPGH